MRIGDPVRVRATGSEGVMAEDVGKGRRRVEFCGAEYVAEELSAD